MAEYGLLTGEELKAEGYIADYVEGLVDQSITMDSVAFCGHSKHVFQGEYSSLEEVLLQEMGKQWPSLASERLSSMVQEWSDLGLRPSTIGKMCEGFGLLELRDSICCSSDTFIESCARINLGKRTDLINIDVPCLS